MTNQVKVSFIICTYNRRAYLMQCLEACIQQTTDYQDYEVIVIDNNSTDDTAQYVDEFIVNKPSHIIKRIVESNQGHSHARNRGVNESQGIFLAFLDDDAAPHEDYVKNLLAFFQAYPTAAGVGGKIIPQYETGTPPIWMSSYLLPLVAALDMGMENKRFPKGKFPIGANMIYQAWVFKKYGQFDIALGRRGSGLEGGEEKDFADRLQKAGEKLWYVPSVQVHHFISEKRTKLAYIRDMGIGVGTSERKRLRNKPAKEIFLKIIDESVKIVGTFILSIWFSCKGQFAKAWMLVRFRYWVVSGLLKQTNHA